MDVIFLMKQEGKKNLLYRKQKRKVRRSLSLSPALRAAKAAVLQYYRTYLNCYLQLLMSKKPRTSHEVINKPDHLNTLVSRIFKYLLADRSWKSVKILEQAPRAP